ncbi:MAG: Na/Pi cotransporter family protein [Alphaproteobacteria bacterium]|nr:Na/Pi cotransporter family protein [Alphaproteobacteria bacterium]
MTSTLANPLSGTAVLIQLLGAVALMLWGLRTVRTGVLRASGGTLRRWLGEHLRARVPAFLAGLGVAVLLQSATATVMLAASFTARGLMTAPMGLAVALGADVGTTLVAQALAFDLSWLHAALILAGVATFMSGEATRRRDIGRAVLGLGLTLLALRLIVQATAPLREASWLASLFAALAGEPVLATLVGAVLTWLAHSSLAVVLLIATLAEAGLVAPTLALALVLGANIGGALPAVTATWRSEPEARRVAVGNLAFRAIGAELALLPLGTVAPLLAQFGGGARLVVNGHTAFNLVLAVAALPLLDLAARLLTRLLPTPARAEDPGKARHLDPAALENPDLALAAAARETLRMGDVIETMLHDSAQAFMRDDRKLVEEVAARDNVLDALHEAIKLYLTQLSRRSGFLSDAESRRAMEIITYTTNLEHVGDIIDKNLMELAEKKIKNRLRFSAEGQADITAMFERVQETLKLSLAVFMTGQPAAARKLLEEKVRLRTLEREAADKHFARLRENRPESVETSALHLDVLRDLKRINSHLVSSAYPILEAMGELRASRLSGTP